MKKNAILTLTACALAGCAADDHLYFGTGTSVGLDVTGTPASPISASLAYKRTEVSFADQEKGREPYSVMGLLDMNVDFWAGTKVEQHFATGDASEIAAYTAVGDQGEIDALLNRGEMPPCETEDDSGKKFLFLTGSTIGIDLDLSKGDPHAVIGYKRLESAYIPVCLEQGRAGSVYSYLLFDSTEKDGVFFTSTQIRQSFASGKAAKVLASQSDLGNKVVKSNQPE